MGSWTGVEGTHVVIWEATEVQAGLSMVATR